MKPKEINQYRWVKFGMVYDSTKHNPAWGSTHALVPHPMVTGEKTAKIFCSFIDADFRGRIGWVEITFDGEPKVKAVSRDPFLDLGPIGSFSQYGVGMGTFWPRNPEGDLYFVGFDRPEGYKFKAFSGRASYDAKTKTHLNLSTSPSFGSELGGETIVGIHDIFAHKEKFHALISVGSGFEKISGSDFPKYEVYLASGPSLEALEISKKPIIRAESPIYRIGRPRIYEIDGGFEILVTAGNLSKEYYPKAYFSSDLKSFSEISTGNFTEIKVPGFDDVHQCYLSRFNLDGKEYIVYNGNEMGRFGFGIAEGIPID